jgi:hypothetical protein
MNVSIWRFLRPDAVCPCANNPSVLIVGTNHREVWELCMEFSFLARHNSFSWQQISFRNPSQLYYQDKNEGVVISVREISPGLGRGAWSTSRPNLFYFWERFPPEFAQYYVLSIGAIFSVMTRFIHWYPIFIGLTLNPKWLKAQFTVMFVMFGLAPAGDQIPVI